MSASKPPPRSPRRPSDWKPAEKLRILAETEGLEGEELGAVLRREGLREPISRSGASCDGGAGRRGEAAPGTPDTRRVRELEKQLRRKDKALAEAAALLVLQRKVQAIWGDEDDHTCKETDK